MERFALVNLVVSLLLASGLGAGSGVAPERSMEFEKVRRPGTTAVATRVSAPAPSRLKPFGPAPVPAGNKLKPFQPRSQPQSFAQAQPGLVREPESASVPAGDAIPTRVAFERVIRPTKLKPFGTPAHVPASVDTVGALVRFEKIRRSSKLRPFSRPAPIAPVDEAATLVRFEKIRRSAKLKPFAPATQLDQPAATESAGFEKVRRPIARASAPEFEKVQRTSRTPGRRTLKAFE